MLVSLAGGRTGACVFRRYTLPDLRPGFCEVFMRRVLASLVAFCAAAFIQPSATDAADLLSTFVLPGTAEVTTAFASSHNRVGFAGYLFDLETGLYFAKTRYYDPGVGRFIQQD